MTPDESEYPLGRFERVCDSAPPIEAEWDPDSIDPDARNWPIGRFERVCESYPPVEPGWEPDPTSLVLTLELIPQADPTAVSYDVSDLLLRLGRLEQSLGGSGFVRDRGTITESSATVCLVLVPVTMANAAERLRAIAEDAKAALQGSATIARFNVDVRIAA